MYSFLYSALLGVIFLLTIKRKEKRELPFLPCLFMGYVCYMNLKYKAIYTVEIAFIMPVIILLLSGVVLSGFYFHDKNVLYGKIYEMGNIARQEYRMPEDLDLGKLESALTESFGQKLLLFEQVICTVEEENDGILITGEMEYQGKKLVSSQYFTFNDTEKNIRIIKPIE